jgi:hypothetical protein
LEVSKKYSRSKRKKEGILTMSTDTYLNLNSLPVRKAILDVILCRDNYKPEDQTLKVRDIRFDNKRRMLILRKKDIFYYDRHLHYPKKVDHIIAAYDFLEDFKKVLNRDKNFF